MFYRFPMSQPIQNTRWQAGQLSAIRQNKNAVRISLPTAQSLSDLDYEQMMVVNAPVQRRKMIVIPWFVKIGSAA